MSDANDATCAAILARREAERKRRHNRGPAAAPDTLVVKLPPGTVERIADRGMAEGLGPGQWAAGVLLRELGRDGTEGTGDDER